MKGSGRGRIGQKRKGAGGCSSGSLLNIGKKKNRRGRGGEEEEERDDKENGTGRIDSLLYLSCFTPVQPVFKTVCLTNTHTL